MLCEDKLDIEREKERLRIIQYLLNLRKILMKLHQLGLAIHEVTVNKAFPKKPYEREHSEAFIKAAKKNDLRTMKKLLLTSRYLVYAYDWTNMTALHWAAKRGHLEVCQWLLDQRADPGSLDAIERCPLYYAMISSRVEVMFLLIERGATIPQKLMLSELRKCKTSPVITVVLKILKMANCLRILVKRADKQQKLDKGVRQRVKYLEMMHLTQEEVKEQEDED
jgi:ankyrin repeat protein